MSAAYPLLLIPLHLGKEQGRGGIRPQTPLYGPGTDRSTQVRAELLAEQDRSRGEPQSRADFAPVPEPQAIVDPGSGPLSMSCSPQLGDAVSRGVQSPAWDGFGEKRSSRLAHATVMRWGRSLLEAMLAVLPLLHVHPCAFPAVTERAASPHLSH